MTPCPSTSPSRPTTFNFASIQIIRCLGILTYLATQIGNNFFFLSQTTDNGTPNLNPWLPGDEPPIFAEGRSKSVCLGPFSKESLQGLSVYAGVGVTLKDLLKTGSHAKIFDGFVPLPQPVKAWTVMVYIVGSNLESSPNHWGSRDLIEMLRGTQQATTDAINVVVTTGGSKRYGWNTVKRLFIHNGQQYVLSEPGHGLNYEHLLTTMTNNPPEDGISFGKIAKTGYFQQSQAQKTFKTSQITYSVLDLTQLPQLWENFGQFATELKTVFTDSSFLTTEMLSRGIIRAPGYPVKSTGRLRSLDKGKDDSNNIRIDLYNVLQTVSPDEEFKQLKSYAEELQTSLQQLVVDYEANDKVKDIDPEAGRISLDIGSEKPYLSLLPAAYTQLNEALDLYNRKRKADTSEPTGEFTCPGGLICADAKWWNLKADEVINIDGYYGQQAEQGVAVYLIKPLYRYQPLAQTLEIGVNGQEACQYQLCVSDTECSNLTVTESQGLWLADVVYNDLPAILTLCQEDNATWKACSVLPQQDSVWGRDGPLSAGDTVTPTVLHLQDGELTQQPSPSLVVGETVPVIKPVCDMPKAVITASYFGNNYKSQFERLCDKGDCV